MQRNLHGFFVYYIIVGMHKVTTLTLPQGFDIDILFKNGKLGYTFQYDGSNYGTAIRPESRKVEDIAAACLLLLVNAQEVYKELTR
jgi:hypothetical protein